jgi:outer membrane protein assembly factor BamB
MKIRELLIIGLIVVAVMVACAGLGLWAGRSGTQRVVGLHASVILGIPVTTPPNISSGRRIRLYLGPEIAGEPAFTIVAGRVYRGNDLHDAFLTLDQKQVYSGSGTAGPLLYQFDGSQVLAGSPTGPAQFIQRDSTIYFGPDPEAPALFTFQGTRVYRGDPESGRIVATSNTVLNDPDLVKLVTIVLYMETLE